MYIEKCRNFCQKFTGPLKQVVSHDSGLSKQVSLYPDVYTSSADRATSQKSLKRPPTLNVTIYSSFPIIRGRNKAGAHGSQQGYLVKNVGSPCNI